MKGPSVPGVGLGKCLSHRGSLSILQPHPSCQPPQPREGAEAHSAQPLLCAETLDGSRLAQQRSALFLPGSGSQSESGSGLMGQPPVMALLQARSLMVHCYKPLLRVVPDRSLSPCHSFRAGLQGRRCRLGSGSPTCPRLTEPSGESKPPIPRVHLPMGRSWESY